MALHGRVQVNGITVVTWQARRVEDLYSSEHEHLYICEYVDHDLALQFTVSHRYSDGAAELARKVLTAGQGGW
jgi:hypothetical protein